jgi:hypothetical protein
MKRLVLILVLLVAPILPASAQQYYDIDVDLPSYPEMAPVPDSPVYYAPGVDSNYFFYDGLFWDYAGDNWYSSPWYNGPWVLVEPVYVPTYVLWVPCRFYRRPPAFFSHWSQNRPPRWGEHWGADWQRRHNSVFSANVGIPVRAPLPTYQRQFNRENYPRGAMQSTLHVQNYGYHPYEPLIRQHYERRGMIPQPQPPQQVRPRAPQERVREESPPAQPVLVQPAQRGERRY